MPIGQMGPSPLMTTRSESADDIEVLLARVKNLFSGVGQGQQKLVPVSIESANDNRGIMAAKAEAITHRDT